jgi:hypothetical protein
MFRAFFLGASKRRINDAETLPQYVGRRIGMEKQVAK